MEMMLLYRERVSNYMLLGAKCGVAYEVATLDLMTLGPVRNHLLAHDLAVNDAIKRVLEEVVHGKLPADFKSMQIVIDGGSGPLVTIPRPSCMEMHLPKDTRPTPEQFERAWERCTRAQS